MSGAQSSGLARALALKILAPAGIGVVTGAAVAALTVGIEGRALDALAAARDLVPALAPLLALPLAVLAALYVTRTLRPSTSELYVETYTTPGGRIPVGQLPGRLLAAVATVGLGGSQGFESPSAMIGASLGELIARVRRIAIAEDERRALVVAGASAGIAAVFSSPGVGALYGLEIPFRRDVDAPHLVPAAVAAAASFATHSMLAGSRELVSYAGPTKIDAVFVAGVIVVGVACGLGARLFAAALTGLRALARAGSPWTRAFAGGLLLAALAWAGRELSGAWVTFGPGYIAGEWIETGEHAVPLLFAILLIRTAGTLVSVWGGGGGGVFTSLACTGVFIGWLIGEMLVPGSEQALALLGSATFLAAGYRIPLAGVLLVAETSGELALTAAGLGAIAIAQVMMGDASVSNAQVDRRASMGSA